MNCIPVGVLSLVFAALVSSAAMAQSKDLAAELSALTGEVAALRQEAHAATDWTATTTRIPSRENDNRGNA